MLTKNNTITAIVPMRHNSERVPEKNYRDFAGKPLFYWIIKSLLDAEVFENIVIDTDSPVIKSKADGFFGKNIQLLDRPKHLIDGSIPMNDVLLNIVNQKNSDFYFQTHSTNPLLSVDTIKNSVETFLQLYPKYDSLFAVTRMQIRLWDVLGRAVNHNENILLRTQDLPPIYEENSCIYIFKKEILIQKRNRIGFRPYLFEIDAYECQDIDEELDFKIAEFIHKELK